MPASSALTLSPAPGAVPQPGYFCSRMVSLPSISLICSAPASIMVLFLLADRNTLFQSSEFAARMSFSFCMSCW